MGEVIEFPGVGDAGIRKALDYFRAIYLEAGLTIDETRIALDELEPIVRQFLINKGFEMTIGSELGFDELQTQAIINSHNSCMQDAISYFGQQLWLAVCTIAGLVGRNAQRT